MIVIFIWNEDKKLIVKYSKSEDINESSFRCVKKCTHVFQYLETWHILRLLLEKLTCLVVGVISAIYLQRMIRQIS